MARGSELPSPAAGGAGALCVGAPELERRSEVRLFFSPVGASGAAARLRFPVDRAARVVVPV